MHARVSDDAELARGRLPAHSRIHLFVRRGRSEGQGRSTLYSESMKQQGLRVCPERPYGIA